MGNILISGKPGSIEHENDRPCPILILYFAEKLLESWPVIIFAAFNSINKFRDDQIAA
jgi:hypothetical protein